MLDKIHEMVATLRKSATEIVAAGLDNPDELLEKSYNEFETALTGVFEAATAPLAGVADTTEEPLFKGLGCVGRVANLVGVLADRIDCIKRGVDYSGQDASKDADTPSDEVAMFLSHCLSMGELAMRAAVNEHVDIADEDDDAGDGGDDGDAAPVQYMVMKSADGADLRVKTRLPEPLAKFATDPVLIDAQAIEMSGQVMTAFGVAPEALVKLFDEIGHDSLHKAAPVDDTGGGADDGADGGADDGGDPAAKLMAALNLLGRLQAASIIQLHSVMEMLGFSDGADDGAGDGTGDGADDGGDGTATGAADDATATGAADDGTADTGAGDGAADPGADDEKKKKNPFAKVQPDGAMAKVAADPRIDQLTGQVSALEELLQKLSKRPEMAKAILDVSGGEMMTKGAVSPAKTPEEIAAAIDLLAGEEKAIVLTKIARGVPPERALRKF